MRDCCCLLLSAGQGLALLAKGWAAGGYAWRRGRRCGGVGEGNRGLHCCCVWRCCCLGCRLCWPVRAHKIDVLQLALDVDEERVDSRLEPSGESSAWAELVVGYLFSHLRRMHASARHAKFELVDSCRQELRLSSAVHSGCCCIKTPSSILQQVVEHVCQIANRGVSARA